MEFLFDYGRFLSFRWALFYGNGRDDRLAAPRGGYLGAAFEVALRVD